MKHVMLFALPLLAAAPLMPANAKPANLKWMAGPPGLPTGSQFAVVSGDPGKAEMFTIELKMPAGYAVPAHHHPTDETLKVLSGSIGYGMGDKLDHAKAKTLATGHSAVMKAKMNHWVFANAPATVEIKAMGPFQITYANPKDDPRK